LPAHDERYRTPPPVTLAGQQHMNATVTPPPLPPSMPKGERGPNHEYVAERRDIDRSKLWDAAERYSATLARQDAKFVAAVERAIADGSEHPLHEAPVFSPGENLKSFPSASPNTLAPAPADDPIAALIAHLAQRTATRP
jgi:hypothetical protein